MPRVLLLDDDPTILLVMTAILESAGHEVLATMDPDAVLALALAERPDAAILDVRVPGRSGLDVLAEVRAQEPLARLPVLVMSARPGDRELGMRAGATEYLPKPFDAAELLAKVASLLGSSAGAAAARS